MQLKRMNPSFVLELSGTHRPLAHTVFLLLCYQGALWVAGRGKEGLSCPVLTSPLHPPLSHSVSLPRWRAGTRICEVTP